MIVVNYSRRKVLLRSIPVQLIGAFCVVVLAQLAGGDLNVRSPLALTSVVVATLLLFAFVDYMLIDILRKPDILRITDDGALRWRTILGERNLILNAGTTVRHGRRGVFITPPVKGIPHARHVDGGTKVTLPGGLREIPDGEFTIVQHRS